MAETHPRVLHAITADRWAIQEDALNRIVLIAQGLNAAPESVAAKLGRPLDNTRTVTRRGSVAIVPVTGPIFRYANLFTEVSGATSIDILAKDFRAAVDDPSVSAIVLEIDSPGGQVAGVSEFAEQVRAGAQKKGVVAYVSDLGASAAYWIASAASEIVARDTARLGSIGVVLRAISGADKNEIKFVSSQSPNKHADPASDAGQAQYQQEVDKLAGLFIDAVASYRGVTADKVIADFGRGGVMIGQDAVSAGLADRLGSLESVLSKLNDQTPPRGKTMAEQANPMTREKFAADHPDLLASIIKEGWAIGHADGLAEGSANERKRIQDVEAQAMPGHEDLIAALKYDGKTTGAEAAVQIIVAEKKMLASRHESLRNGTHKPLPFAHAPLGREGNEVGEEGDEGEDPKASRPNINPTAIYDARKARTAA